MLQRDAFINVITKKLETDKTIFFLSADFGAAALDGLREKFPNNFIHCGISEQAMLDVASGLALEGNKVFVYAMAPFISLRSIEQTKCGAGLMNLPICLISVGIGLGYADAGPTHYSTEDFACFRSIVGSSIYTPSDVNTAKMIAEDMLNVPKFSYVRLDREVLKNLSPEITTQEYKEECSPAPMYGYQRPLNEQCATITGGMVSPEEQCNSLWNNMTRRKTLIKDY